MNLQRYFFLPAFNKIAVHASPFLSMKSYFLGCKNKYCLAEENDQGYIIVFNPIYSTQCDHDKFITRDKSAVQVNHFFLQRIKPKIVQVVDFAVLIVGGSNVKAYKILQAVPLTCQHPKM